MSGLMWRRKLLSPASKTDTTRLFIRDAGLFVREEINQRLFRIRQRVRGIRIGARRSGRGRTGCRECAIGLLARRRHVRLAGSCVGARHFLVALDGPVAQSPPVEHFCPLGTLMTACAPQSSRRKAGAPRRAMLRTLWRRCRSQRIEPCLFELRSPLPRNVLRRAQMHPLKTPKSTRPNA